MATIAFDNATDGVNSASFSHTCTGAGILLFVGFTSDTNTTYTVTYNGISMTQIGSVLQTPSSNLYNYLFYLKNAPSGAHTVSITGSGNLFPLAASYTQAALGVDASNTGSNANANTLTTHVTTTVDKDWTIALCNAAGGAISAGNGILRKSNSGPIFTSIIDSNGFVSPAGDTFLTMNDTQLNKLAMIVAAFKPGLLGGGFFAFF